MVEHKEIRHNFPFRKGEVIRVNRGASRLIVELNTDGSASTLTWVYVSKWSLIRTIQKFYYLKIKYNGTKKNKQK